MHDQEVYLVFCQECGKVITEYGCVVSEMATAVTQHLRQRGYHCLQSAFSLLLLQTERVAIHRGQAFSQVGKPRRAFVSPNRYPKNATPSDFLNIDCVARFASRQIHLQDGQTMSLKESLMQTPQILLHPSGSTVPIDVSIAHDRKSIQSARLDKTGLSNAGRTLGHCHSLLHSH